MRETLYKQNAAVASDRLYRAVRNVIQEAHGVVSRVANWAMVEANWRVGFLIVEDEQKGKRKLSSAKKNGKTKGQEVMIENAITSFSYKRESPEEKMAIGDIGTGNISTLATLTTFDCQAMPNPYWDESLRGYTGRDKPIADFFARIPARSVYFAERMSERLLGIDGVEAEVTHAARQHWNVKTKEEYDGEC